MAELDELYAACIVEYAHKRGGKLSGPSYVMVKDTRDSYDLPYDEGIFKSAMDILADLGALKKYSHEGMQAYYSLEAKKFFDTMGVGGLDVRNYQISSPFETDRRTYSFLESYADLGSDFLSDAIETYRARLDELGDEDGFEWTDVSPPLDREDTAQSIQSSAWTGLPSSFDLTEERRVELVRDLDRAESDIEALGISQDIKSQARAYIIAARTLAEAPDPPVDVIWNLIGRANSLAGIASLLVSIIALFTTVAH